MPFVRSHDTDIYLEAVGAGPAILFAHGCGGELEAFDAALERFL